MENNKEKFYQKQVLNPYPTESQSYTAWERGFIEGWDKKTETDDEPKKERGWREYFMPPFKVEVAHNMICVTDNTEKRMLAMKGSGLFHLGLKDDEVQGIRKALAQEISDLLNYGPDQNNSEVDKLKAKLNYDSDVIEKLRSENKRLEYDLDIAHKSICIYTNTIREQDKTINILTSEHEDQKQKLEFLHKERDQQSYEITRQNKLINRLKDQLDNISSFNHPIPYTRTIDELEKEKAELKGTVNTYHDMNDTLSEELRSANGKVEKLEKENAELRKSWKDALDLYKQSCQNK